MYAVVSSGGKQYRVEEGQRILVERLGVDEGAEVQLTPVMVVDGDAVIASRGDLAGASVTGKVIGEAKGPKVIGFTYKNKSNNRRRWGHRQRYADVEITKISKG